ncbi:unnamed protein product [Prunus armeniaca]|uniref:Uncharacterized protein n=1 Tax=Prunus armeniaca TaxID=36596 RepID=A0A6J5U1I5_PRUAR|nr:unnamed protein product [Prunus armeniaca]
MRNVLLDVNYHDPYYFHAKILINGKLINEIWVYSIIGFGSARESKKDADAAGVVIDSIVCSTEIFVATYHTSTGKALAFTSSSASSHLDSQTQHANSPNSSSALQRSLTSVAASKMKKALGLKSPGSGSKKNLGSGGFGSGLEKPKRVMTVGELMRIQIGISDAMDSRVRIALLRISAAGELNFCAFLFVILVDLEGAAVAVVEEVKNNNHVVRKLKKHQQICTLDQHIEEQFGGGRLLACIIAWIGPRKWRSNNGHMSKMKNRGSA